MKIALAIPSLCAGGAERVITRMANYWAEAGHTVTVITLRPVEEDFYTLPDCVKRISLDIRRIATNRFEGVAAMLLAILRLRRAVRTIRPNVVISFIEIMNVAVLLALAGTTVPVVVSERIDPREYPASSVLNRLRRWLYPRACRVVVQTESVRAWAEKIVPAEQVVVIPNPIARPPDGAAAGKVAPGGRTAVAMGRLVTQKAFDLLIEAFAQCAKSHPDWSLLILGDGEERDNLAALAKRLGLAGRVSMPGRVAEPVDFLRGSDLFVMPSRYEGFPNALCEAMSVGLPVLSTDCPSGPGEIVRNGIDGVLVPTENVEALSAAMGRLMGDCMERQRLGRAATAITERFGVDGIMRLWESILPSIDVAK
jgi:GalNAc-alpha-(1->4)-GalNAc-alpha-(1->3)-diNAcBac-PP-undecaprenol alpha-1,4-N-acetyl-D-galactosaminyltransferase